jgi:predicted O-methyltransferase YrrM
VVSSAPPETSLEAVLAYVEAVERAGRAASPPRRGVALLQAARALRRAAEEIAAHSARVILAETVSGCPSIDEAMAFAYTFDLRGFDVGIRPLQIPGEFRALLERLVAAPPRRIVEIGAANGGTLFLFATAAADDALIVSIDVPEGYRRRREKLHRAFARKGQRIELMRADSHDPGTVQTTGRLLGGRDVDLLFIDGDHSYEGVRADYLNYSPFVRDGGLIAFHDIVPGPERHVGEAPRFWKELRQTVEVEEVVQDWRQGDSGIGLVRVSAR